MCKSTIAFFWLGVLSLAFLGCGLRSEPVWTPDSKSFLFTKANGSLAQYDIDKQSSRTLFEHARSRPRRPAVSPDGKLAAVAIGAWGEESEIFGLRLYQLPSGKLVDLQIHKHGDQSKPMNHCDSSVYWCPSGERIVICYLAGKNADKVEAIVYHLKQTQFRRLTSRPPAASFGAAFGFSPLRPDGAGYLAIDVVNNELKMAFIDWDGWERQISVAPELNGILAAKGRGNGGGEDALVAMFAAVMPIPHARWEDKVLALSLAGGLVRIDTEKQVATYTKDARAVADQQKFLVENILTYRDFPDGRYRVQCSLSSGTARLELAEPAKQRKKILLEGIKTDLIPFVLSPNGKYMLVPLVTEQGSMIWLIRNDGEIVAKLDTNGA